MSEDKWISHYKKMAKGVLPYRDYYIISESSNQQTGNGDLNLISETKAGLDRARSQMTIDNEIEAVKKARITGGKAKYGKSGNKPKNKKSGYKPIKRIKNGKVKKTKKLAKSKKQKSKQTKKGKKTNKPYMK